MQLVQPSKFFSVTIFRTRSTGSIGMRARTCYVAIFSNAEKFRCLYSHCMPSSPKEYISPCLHHNIVCRSVVYYITELEITAGHRPFSDQNGKTTDQVPICLDMNPIGFLLCPSKSCHARTSDQNPILISSSVLCTPCLPTGQK